MTSPLASTYADARAAFLDAAADAGARIESFDHPLAGREGEPLFVDVAEVGPRDAASVLVVVSGTHGVEGYLGSAIQTRHLRTFDTEREGGPAVVFVHALNPYGFSWVRRVNEDNVDLNRNFIDWDGPRPRNDGYASIAEALVPGDWSAATQDRTRSELGHKLGELGMDGFQQAVSGGQYDHPAGLFYGGDGPTWSHRWLRDFVTRRLADAARVVVIDLHTGLGPWGHGELISSDHPGSTNLARQQEWWDGVISIHDDASVSAELAGEWLAAVPADIPAAEFTGVAIEYGTVDPIQVLEGLRADAVLHGHGDPTGPDAEEVRRQVRAAFIDDDPAWFEACWPRYHSVVTTALERLG